jgi:hypothetical protein
MISMISISHVYYVFTDYVSVSILTERNREKEADRMREGMSMITERIKSLEGATKTIAAQSTPPPPPPQSGVAPFRGREAYSHTYEYEYGNAAVNRISARGHASAQVRGEDGEKQIILSAKNQKENDVAKGLNTETELITKAEMTLKLMLEEGETPPTEVKFVGGKRTRSGAVIYTLNMKEAAEWIRGPETLRRFKEKYGGPAEIRTKLFNVMAYYVPISFDPESEEAKQKTEVDNGFRRGSLVHARYIKPIHRRSPKSEGGTRNPGVCVQGRRECGNSQAFSDSGRKEGVGGKADRRATEMF